MSFKGEVMKKTVVGLLVSILFIGCGSSSTEGRVEESLLKSKFINNSSCDEIIDKVFLEICYDNSLKAAKSVAYKLDGDLVNELNIKDRPFFYEEPSLDRENRASFRDYTRSGYDRGHLAPDAAFDWSEESLEATYSLANIIPQIPEVNQEMWVDVEKLARRKAVELGSVNVLNIVKYNSNPNRIGANGIAVSKGYYKVLYNKDENYEACYYYENRENINSSSDTKERHLVECSTVNY